LKNLRRLGAAGEAIFARRFGVSEKMGAGSWALSGKGQRAEISAVQHTKKRAMQDWKVE
jgi:hypothetical protein